MKSLLLVLVVSLGLSGCAGAFGDAADYLTGPVSGVGLKPSTSIVSGEQERLSAVVVPLKTENKKVYWSSSNKNVAAVDQNGIVTAVAVVNAGETEMATITVETEEGNYSANCVVTVVEKPVPVTDVVLNKNVSSLVVSGAEQLSYSISPSDATNQTITWTSDAPAIVSVDSSGLVTAKQAGTGIITASSSNGKSATCKYTVVSAPVAVTDIRLNKTASVIAAGKTESFFPIVTPSNATNQNVSWTTSNSAIATVNSLGVVSGIAASATPVIITATTTDGSNISASVPVTVVASAINVAGVSLSRSTATITVGRQQQLIATIAPSNATNQTLVWKSSNTSVAVVDAGGIVTALEEGSAVISVTTADGGFSRSCMVYATSLPTYRVIYAGGSGATGTAPLDMNAYLPGTNAVVLGNSFTNGVSVFSEWKDSSGKTYQPGTVLEIGNTDKNLTAQWTASVSPTTYVVSYIANFPAASEVSGSVPASSTVYPLGAEITVLSNSGNLAVPGYVFGGWKHLSTLYQSGAKIIMGSGNIVLSAEWIPVYTVTYKGNGETGGSVPTDSATYQKGDSVSVKMEVPIKAGYAFVGWECNNILYQPGATFFMGAANVELKAVWSAGLANMEKLVYDTPGVYSYVLPNDAKLVVKAWGGAGSGPVDTLGGQGGYVYATSDVYAHQMLHICVGAGGIKAGPKISGVPAAAGDASYQVDSYRGGGGSVVAVEGAGFRLIACAGGGGGACKKTGDKTILGYGGGRAGAPALGSGYATNGGTTWEGEGLGGYGQSISNPGSNWNTEPETFSGFAGTGGKSIGFGSGGGGYGGGGGGGSNPLALSAYESAGGGSYTVGSEGYTLVGLGDSINDFDYVLGVGAAGLNDAGNLGATKGGNGRVVIYILYKE